MEFQKLLRYSFVLASIAVLGACSSADSVAPVAPVTPTSVTVSGSVFASDVNNATVTVKKPDGTIVAGPVTTNPDGTYSVDMLDTDLTGDLVFESTGGTFDDEATTNTDVPAGAMSAYVTGGTLSSTNGLSVHMTPGTTIIADLATKHGKTPAEGRTAHFDAFAYNTDISVDPVEINDPAVFNADDASRHIGWRAAVMSKLAMDLMLAPEEQFALFTAMAEDLADGQLDAVALYTDLGAAGIAQPTDILDKYKAAMDSFDTADATPYQVTYEPPMMNVHGKNVFKLTIVDTSGGGGPAIGLADGVDPDLEVMPIMYMNGMTHGTPMGSITETAPGEYTVTAYYLMPSRMMNGDTMGTWDLKATIGTKSVHFYPNIDMAMMNNTARTQLIPKGVDDMIIDMAGLPVNRPYFLFRETMGNPSPNGANYDFDIFVATRETMMSHPPLVVGDTLESGMGGTPLDVTSVDIDINVNDGGWQSNKDMPSGNDDGIWTLNAIQLDSNPGVANTIKVRLIVNSETKTTDGNDAVADVNDFATFTVTFLP